MVTFDDNIFDLVLVKLMWDGAVDGLATHGEVGVTRCLGLINDPTLPEDSVLNILFIVNREKILRSTWAVQIHFSTVRGLASNYPSTQNYHKNSWNNYK